MALASATGARRKAKNFSNIRNGPYVGRYDYRGMRSVLGAACAGLFFVWDLSVNHAAYTHGIADVGHYCLAMLWHLMV